MAKEESRTDDESPVEQPSFNGKLQQFSYDPATNHRPTRRSPRLNNGVAPTPTADLKPAPRSPKRKADDTSPSPTLDTTAPSLASSTSPSPRKRAKTKARTKTGTKLKKGPGYAPPEKYAHLNLLPDTLEEGLICAFVGLNPGIKTAEMGHA